MTAQHATGPYVQFGAGLTADNNGDRAPAAFDLGEMLLDPRALYTYQPGRAPRIPLSTDPWKGVNGFLGGSWLVLDQAPSTLAVANIAASQTPGAGAIALVSSSGAGITIATSIVRADNGAAVSGLLAIDGATKRLP